jgi:hypothetical protein
VRGASETARSGTAAAVVLAGAARRTRPARAGENFLRRCPRQSAPTGRLRGVNRSIHDVGSRTDQLGVEGGAPAGLGEPASASPENPARLPAPRAKRGQRRASAGKHLLPAPKLPRKLTPAEREFLTALIDLEIEKWAKSQPKRA